MANVPQPDPDETGTLRPATPADVAEVTELFLRARSEAMPWLRVVHTEAETRDWLEHVVLARPHAWVVEQGGRVLGFAALHDGWLEHLYAEPAAQGRGLGRQLLDLAKQQAPGGLRLHVFARNARARRFYESAGFLVEETSDGSGNEEGEPDVTYAWRPSGGSSRPRSPRSGVGC